MPDRLILNPDRELVKKIIAAIDKNGGHCPCVPEKNEATLCPCDDFQQHKICHCNLYVSKAL